MDPSREQRLAETFVELADTLVAEFDVVDFMQTLADRCVELLRVRAAGLMLTDLRGELRVVAASSELARLVELFEMEADEGPCLTCFRTGTPVLDVGLSQRDPRWPRYTAQACTGGFTAVHALPLRLRTETIGVLVLLSTAPDALDQPAVRLAQSLADVATVGLLQERAIQQRQILAEQLEGALNSRILIEQAKGVLAHRLDLDMEAAFSHLRSQARSSGRRLTDVAKETIAGYLEPHGPAV